MLAYHGTSDIIDRFNIYNNMGSNTGNNDGAIFFTSDEEVAYAYSRENYKRKYEGEDKYINNEDLLEDDAEKQQHIYKVDINTDNALVIDIADINSKEFYKAQHKNNVLDSYLLNHIINILQNRQYEKFMECYDEQQNCLAIDFILPYIEEYDEEQDEYIEKDYYYDCIIINNAIDSIDEVSHDIPSTIIAVLDENIINNKELLVA